MLKMPKGTTMPSKVTGKALTGHRHTWTITSLWPNPWPLPLWLSQSGEHYQGPLASDYRECTECAIAIPSTKGRVTVIQMIALSTQRCQHKAILQVFQCTCKMAPPTIVHGRAILVVLPFGSSSANISCLLWYLHLCTACLQAAALWRRLLA